MKVATSPMSARGRGRAVSGGSWLQSDESGNVVRAAVQAFIERYNQAWLVEKNGFRSPAQARAAWLAAALPVAA